MVLRFSVPCHELTARRALLGLARSRFELLACSRDPKVAKAIRRERRPLRWPRASSPKQRSSIATPCRPIHSDGDLRLKLGDVYAKSGQGRQAAEEFIRAADLLVDRVDVQVRAGNILLLSGRFDDAKVTGGEGAGARSAQRRRADSARELARRSQGSQRRRRRARRSHQARTRIAAQLHEPRRHRGDAREAGGGGARVQEGDRARRKSARRTVRSETSTGRRDDQRTPRRTREGRSRSSRRNVLVLASMANFAIARTGSTKPRHI